MAITHHERVRGEYRKPDGTVVRTLWGEPAYPLGGRKSFDGPSSLLLKLDGEVHLPAGASEQTVRTVTENSRSLKFESHAFETE